MHIEFIDANQFGCEWGLIKTPVTGTVAIISSYVNDPDINDEEKSRRAEKDKTYNVGLSATQLDNLFRGQKSRILIVEYNGQKVFATVDNSYSDNMGDSEIRISLGLSEKLGLELQDKVKLDREETDNGLTDKF